MGFVRIEPPSPEPPPSREPHVCQVGSWNLDEPAPEYGEGTIWRCDYCSTSYIYVPWGKWWGALAGAPIGYMVVLLYNFATLGLRKRGGDGWIMIRSFLGATVINWSIYVFFAYAVFS